MEKKKDTYVTVEREINILCSLCTKCYHNLETIEGLMCAVSINI